MKAQSLYHTYQRYRTLKTHRISALPIVILMPHSACNCRCVMCDIWKDNKNLKQLNEEDISGLLSSLKDLGTRQVLMSGGEALMNQHFFRLCQMLKQLKIRITLLSTGLLINRYTDPILKWVDDLIVSLDGDASTHDAIRNISGAYAKLSEGIRGLKQKQPDYRVTSRTVIHRMNFRKWSSIIQSAKEMGINQVSFLPADVSSHAFNREVLWSEQKQHEVALEIQELQEMRDVLDQLFTDHKEDFENGFIAESPSKLNLIYSYYKALHGLCEFPAKKCNAPWVSTVIEADGTVRPCFFHGSLGNIREQSIGEILNGRGGMKFRKELDMTTNDTCRKCVCYLNLPVTTSPV